jgi:CheY-like chemotaxis protein
MTSGTQEDNRDKQDRKRRLLIVDDEADFAEYVGKVGEKLGLNVTVTSTAMDFMGAYKKNRPDIVVLDMVMPGVDGVELIGWLAQQNCTARIIIVTGFNPRYVELAEDLGGAKGLPHITSLTKPVKLADLRAALS